MNDRPTNRRLPRLVRASNTEPIVRLVAEAPTADGAARLCEEGERVIRTVS